MRLLSCTPERYEPLPPAAGLLACCLLLLPPLLLLRVPAPVHAQARPSCAVQPQTLAQMKGCFRPLLVFAPRADDPRLRAQRAILDQAADDMMDRFVLLVPIVSDPAHLALPLDAAATLLPPAEAAAARARFNHGGSGFHVLLLGEDGEVKLRREQPVSADTINSLIDSMPTRRIEMARPHAN